MVHDAFGSREATGAATCAPAAVTPPCRSAGSNAGALGPTKSLTPETHFRVKGMNDSTNIYKIRFAPVGVFDPRVLSAE